MNAPRILLGLLRGLGYLAFFLVCLALFAALTFPTDAARDFVETRGSEALGGADLSIGDLDLGLGGSVELTDVTLKLPKKAASAVPGAPPGAPAPEAKGPPRMVRAERLYVDVGLRGLLFGGDRSAEFEADLQGGTLRDGEATLHEDGSAHLAVGAIEGVRLGPEGLFASLVGYDLRGVLAGTLDLQRGALPHELAGQVDVGLSNAVVVAPVIPTRQLGPIQLTDVHLGELQLKLVSGTASEVGMGRDVKGRRGQETTIIRFEDVGASGEDVEVQFDDQSVIRLFPGQPVSRASLDIHLAIQFKDAYLDKQVRDEKGSTSQPNKILRMALRQDARLRAATRDGILGLVCRGTLAKPECRPEMPRIRGGFKTRKPRFTPSGEAAPAQDEEPPGTDEPEARTEPAAPERPSRAAGPRGRAATDEAREPAMPGSVRARSATPTLRPPPVGRSAMPTLPAEPRPMPVIEPSPGAEELPAEEGVEEPLEEEPYVEGEEPLPEVEEPLHEGEEPLPEGEGDYE